MRLRDSLHRERMMIDCAAIRLILLLFGSANPRVTTRCRDGCKHHLGMIWRHLRGRCDGIVYLDSWALRSSGALSDLREVYVFSKSFSATLPPPLCFTLTAPSSFPMPPLYNHSTMRTAHTHRLANPNRKGSRQ
jgi:hypothetical protein